MAPADILAPLPAAPYQSNEEKLHEYEHKLQVSFSLILIHPARGTLLTFAAFSFIFVCERSRAKELERSELSVMQEYLKNVEAHKLQRRQAAADVG